MTTRLHELRCPVFGFWGVNDLFNPVSGTMKLMDNCPQARMVLVNRCGLLGPGRASRDVQPQLHRLPAKGLTRWTPH